MRKKLLVILLALGASTCLYFVADHVWIRIWARWHVENLESSGSSAFSLAYAALAYDKDERISWLLLDELENSPSRQRHYQIVRVLYTRCGVHYAPEDVRLPGVDELRRMVKETYARGAGGGGVSARGKP